MSVPILLTKPDAVTARINRVVYYREPPLPPHIRYFSISLKLFSYLFSGHFYPIRSFRNLRNPIEILLLSESFIIK